MIYKRATDKIEKAGITGIQIVKRLWGAAPEYVNVPRQRSTCFKTPAQAVEAVLHGFRPTIVEIA